ncbi:MAG TPA: tetratricopeptide repeat protein [Rhodocyclaceae bacterium]
MAVYDLEEQEQLDELKTWWKQYGNLVTSLVTALAVVAVGWQGWNWWQRNQAAQAAALYGGIEKAASVRNVKQARDFAGELIDKYPRTAQAAMGALLSAKVQVEGGDAKNARSQLQWAADNATDDALRSLAKLRLAALLLDDKAYDEALKQIPADTASPFAARFGEVKGDILVAQGKTVEARAAYEAALQQLDKQTKDDAAGQARAYREIVQAKLDTLGAAK